MPLHGGASSQSTDISPMSIDEELSYLALLHDGGPPWQRGHGSGGRQGERQRPSRPPWQRGHGSGGRQGERQRPSRPPWQRGHGSGGRQGEKSSYRPLVHVHVYVDVVVLSLVFSTVCRIACCLLTIYTHFYSPMQYDFCSACPWGATGGSLKVTHSTSKEESREFRPERGISLTMGNPIYVSGGASDTKEVSLPSF